MRKASRNFAALILSLVALSGIAAPNAIAASAGRSAITHSAQFAPNPFRALYRLLKHLIGVQPNDGGQIAPPHPDPLPDPGLTP